MVLSTPVIKGYIGSCGVFQRLRGVGLKLITLSLVTGGGHRSRFRQWTSVDSYVALFEIVLERTVYFDASDGINLKR